MLFAAKGNDKRLLRPACPVGTIYMIHRANGIHGLSRQCNDAGARDDLGLREMPLRIFCSTSCVVPPPKAARQQLIMEHMKFIKRRRKAAMTLPEVLIALVLVAESSAT